MAQTELQFHSAAEEMSYELAPTSLAGIDVFSCVRPTTEPEVVYLAGRRGPKEVDGWTG